MADRMIDRLLRDGALTILPRDGTCTPWQADEVRDPGTGVPLLAQAEVYVCDSVTRFIYEQSPQEDWPWDGFADCTPLAPVMWLETRAPLILRSGPDVRAWPGPAAWGCLLRAAPLPPHQQQAWSTFVQAERQAARAALLEAFARHGLAIPAAAPPNVPAWSQGLPPACREAVSYYQAVMQATPATFDALIPAAARWHYACLPFAQLAPEGPLYGPLGYGLILADATGTLLPWCGAHEERFVAWAVPQGDGLRPAEQQRHLDVAHASLIPFWQAISLANQAALTRSRIDPCHPKGLRKPGSRCSRQHYTVLAMPQRQKVGA